MANLKVTLVKGLAGQTKRQRATAEALGLRKVSNSSIFADSPSVRGQIEKVRHLVSVEEQA